MDNELKSWKGATSEAPWGVQQAIKTTLELVKSEDIKICWGMDDYQGSPCLINAINYMISDSEISPIDRFPLIVPAFDAVNKGLYEENQINISNFVSPLSAEVLLRNMGELKPVPEDASLLVEGVEAFLNGLEATPAGAELMDQVMNPISDDTTR